MAQVSSIHTRRFEPCPDKIKPEVKPIYGKYRIIPYASGQLGVASPTL
ncbi:MAG: hypothetical protein HY785_21170 [Oscillatoriophycideae cyanobacterium NC_groundwater_1537_Pr4_S-0.65um_50_18]|nr:hypothetical protein [Oscillatoriophycideae cyanobacterium NC_groundwater_1537_Pr4_S-0.65um_50_18]